MGSGSVNRSFTGRRAIVRRSPGRPRRVVPVTRARLETFMTVLRRPWRRGPVLVRLPGSAARSARRPVAVSRASSVRGSKIRPDVPIPGAGCPCGDRRRIRRTTRTTTARRHPRSRLCRGGRRGTGAPAGAGGAGWDARADARLTAELARHAADLLCLPINGRDERGSIRAVHRGRRGAVSGVAELGVGLRPCSARPTGLGPAISHGLEDKRGNRNTRTTRPLGGLPLPRPCGQSGPAGWRAVCVR